MLELKNIKKDYPAGSGTVHALKGIDLTFRKSEFVSILGPSGCGKTTMLNIIGGLDGYTEGDLIINGTSTKEYKDRDWDAYRNHSIGFVFQSYNLIPHQSVLQNVELALTLSGVSKAERKKRAKEALEKVGLGDQLNKKPGEMSGGQMQRVAIARALVNNPDIILADEPTGALDTETSVQVMDILKKVSEDRLIIMVTHNPELAEKYSTRIIKMLDGQIIHDSRPLTQEELACENERTLCIKDSKKSKREKKPSMSFFTAFMLSLKNLFTKKGRTTLTSFAGSIGIIGIALILAVSQGMTLYIDSVQESTLSAYPLTLESQTMDMTEMMLSFMESSKNNKHDNDAIYKEPVIGDMVDALAKLEISENDLASFKKYLEEQLKDTESPLYKAISGVQYTYTLKPVVYTKNIDGLIVKSDTSELMAEMIADFMFKVSTNNSSTDNSHSSSDMSSMLMMNPMISGSSMWQELLPGLKEGDVINDVIEDQYDVIYGSWPNDANEVVLVVNEKNEIDDLTLYALGLISRTEIDSIIDAAASGQPLNSEMKKWSYEEVCGLKFKTILPYQCYQDFGGVYVDVSENESMLKMLYETAFEMKVVGIIRPNPEADAKMLTGSIGYTRGLTEHIIKDAKNYPVVIAQLENPTIDVLTGLPFKANTGSLSNEEKSTLFKAYIDELDTKAKAEAFILIQALNIQKQQLTTQVDNIMSTMTDKDKLVEQMSQSIAQQMGVDSQQIAQQLSSLSLQELQDMIRPTIEEQVKAGIEASVRESFAEMTEEALSIMLVNSAKQFTVEECALYYDEITVFSQSTYEQNLVKIGCVDLDDPATINLYTSSFEYKDLIVDEIDRYNKNVDKAHKIAYTDYLGLMMSWITTVINAITYVLIAFVAISLVVSSIMIGVITLISVQERTKEIGILRAIGASKSNVSSMFNAETIIIGFTSGLLGVIVTYLLCIPINIILHSLTDIENLSAVLPVGAAVILVAISVCLTLISGFIPSRSAAKKDPVVALRTE